MGHSQAVADSFYLRLTPQVEEEAHQFQRLPAAGFPAQQMHADSRGERKMAKLPSPQPVTVQSFATSCCTVQKATLPPEGLEPSTL